MRAHLLSGGADLEVAREEEALEAARRAAERDDELGGGGIRQLLRQLRLQLRD
jgi:hypothetical protein